MCAAYKGILAKWITLCEDACVTLSIGMTAQGKSRSTVQLHDKTWAPIKLHRKPINLCGLTVKHSDNQVS